MKVKLYNLINTKDSYLKLIDQGYLPILTRYSLSNDAEVVVKTLNKFDKFKDDLVRQYGETSDDGKTVGIAPTNKNFSLANDELNKLVNIDVELETEKIPEELFLVDACTLTGRDFVVLRNIFISPKVKEEVKEEDKKIETQ